MTAPALPLSQGQNRFWYPKSGRFHLLDAGHSRQSHLIKLRPLYLHERLPVTSQERTSVAFGN